MVVAASIIKGPECPICLEPFSSREETRAPWSFTCGHSCCFSCTEALKNPALAPNYRTCSECRETWKADPTKNFGLISLLNMQAQQMAAMSAASPSAQVTSQQIQNMGGSPKNLPEDSIYNHQAPSAPPSLSSAGPIDHAHIEPQIRSSAPALPVGTRIEQLPRSVRKRFDTLWEDQLEDILKKCCHLKTLLKLKAKILQIGATVYGKKAGPKPVQPGDPDDHFALKEALIAMGGSALRIELASNTNVKQKNTDELIIEDYNIYLNLPTGVYGSLEDYNWGADIGYDKGEIQIKYQGSLSELDADQPEWIEVLGNEDLPPETVHPQIQDKIDDLCYQAEFMFTSFLPEQKRVELKERATKKAIRAYNHNNNTMISVLRPISMEYFSAAYRQGATESKIKPHNRLYYYVQDEDEEEKFNFVQVSIPLVEILRPLARAGDKHAQYQLGTLYKNGTGINKSPVDALVWFQMATHQGHIEANLEAALFYYYGDNGIHQSYTNAKPYLTHAADAGNTQAAYLLGLLYSREGVGQSYALAAKYYQIAANRGDRDAEYALGLLYQSGLGVPKSKKEARRLMESASERGHVGAKEQVTKMQKCCF